MLFNPRDLYLARKKESFALFAPYMRYIAQSGLLLVIAFAGIVFIDQYIKLLRHTPEAFPYSIVITVVVTLALLYTPFRSWLKPADIIYIMPKQQAMQDYLKYCITRGYSQSIIIAAIVIILSYFVFKAYDDSAKLYIILYGVVAKNVVYNMLSTVNLLTNKLKLKLIKYGTYLFTLLSVYFVVEGLFLLSYLLLSIMLVVYYFYVHKSVAAFFNWQQLIEDEQNKVHRMYRFINLFVDVPHVQVVTKRRQYLAQFAHYIKFGKAHTFSFLHYLTFARSEVGGIYVRNIVVGSFIGYIMASTMLWNGYAVLGFAIIFMCINAVQLTTLRQIHRHSVWQNLYPIPLTQQHKQMTSIELKLLLASAVALSITVSVPLMVAAKWELVAYLVSAMLVVIVWRLVVIKRVSKKAM